MAPRAIEGLSALSLVSCPIQLFPHENAKGQLQPDQQETGNRIRYRKVDRTPATRSDPETSSRLPGGQRPVHQVDDDD
jgi:non-homologous end joining protein Ku